MDDLGRLMFDAAQWRAMSKKQTAEITAKDARIAELEKLLAPASDEVGPEPVAVPPAKK